MKYILLLLIFSCINLKNKDTQGYIEYKIKLPKKKYKIGEKIVVEHSLINHFSKPIFFFSYPHFHIVSNQCSKRLQRSTTEYKYYHRLIKINGLSKYEVKYLLNSSIYQYNLSKLKKGKYKMYSIYDFIFTKKKLSSSWTNNREDFYKFELRSNKVEFEIVEKLSRETTEGILGL